MDMYGHFAPPKPGLVYTDYPYPQNMSGYTYPGNVLLSVGTPPINGNRALAAALTWIIGSGGSYLIFGNKIGILSRISAALAIGVVLSVVSYSLYPIFTSNQ